MHSLSLQLKRLRRAKRLTQKQLSRALGISESAIGMYERGEREPSLDTLIGIADFYAVTIDALVGRETNHTQQVMEPPATYNDEPLHNFVQEVVHSPADQQQMLQELWKVIQKHK
ncbi:helix-turn-helix transcriptional regulator [Bacillaceae bacterium SIJ1]|uniref:helix-turn-helix domain-containing protein n=1 Tax=Litoribacterium kuwaitense TaxID=1398745 RepID=UPI0013EC66CA|nr:helix-turn-helix transcriptional regulator [Litoribacterium kuwaitense]NGP45406.1 helix-turn-helix transcriptional regulator [Litoribacterium kuwaitense]